MKVCRDPDYYIPLLGLGTTQGSQVDEEDPKLTNSSQDRPLRYLIHFLGGEIITLFETYSCQKMSKIGEHLPGLTFEQKSLKHL